MEVFPHLHVEKTDTLIHVRAEDGVNVDDYISLFHTLVAEQMPQRMLLEFISDKNRWNVPEVRHLIHEVLPSMTRLPSGSQLAMVIHKTLDYSLARMAQLFFRPDVSCEIQIFRSMSPALQWLKSSETPLVGPGIRAREINGIYRMLLEPSADLRSFTDFLLKLHGDGFPPRLLIDFNEKEYTWNLQEIEEGMERIRSGMAGEPVRCRVALIMHDTAKYALALSARRNLTEIKQLKVEVFRKPEEGLHWLTQG